jgi:putative ABC transport system permease protein
MGRTVRVAAFLAFTSVSKANIGVLLLTVLILAIVTLNMLFVPGLLQGLTKGSDDKVRNTYAGDIVVESLSESPLIPEAHELLMAIERTNGVVAATSRNTMGAEFTFENERTNGVVSAILPEGEMAVFTTADFMIEGSFLGDGDVGKVVLGIQIAGADQTATELYARSLKRVHAGDAILVAYANGVSKNYEVKGIFKTEFIQTDLQSFVTEKEFELVSPQVADKAASIRVKVAGDRSRIVEQIGHSRSGLRILTWEDYAGIVRSMTDSFNVINAILDIVNLLVAGITVFIVTYIDVTNRRRQIGIQRAIGITPAAQVLAYLFRAVFYAAVASLVAALMFLYVVMPLEARYPFHFPFGDVYLITGLPNLVRATCILLCTAVVATIAPVWMALRVKILDAIWG